MRRLKFLLWMFLLPLCTAVWAQPSPLVAAPQARIDLSQAAYVMEDPSGELDFAAASSPAMAGRYTRRDTKFGYTPSSWWLRFEVVNPADATRVWWFDTGNRILNELDFFAPTESGIYQHTGASADRVFADRPVPTDDFVFPLTLQPRQTAVLYLRVRSTLFLPTAIKPALAEPKTYFAAAQRETALWLLYIGMTLALALLNVALWMYLRDPLFGWYVASLFGYVFFASFAQGGVGSAYQLLWPDAPLLNQLAWGVSLVLCVHLMSFFQIYLLKMGQFAPRRVKWFWRVLLLGWVFVGIRVSVLFVHSPQLLAWSHKASVGALITMLTSLFFLVPILFESYRAKVPYSGYSVVSLTGVVVLAPVASVNAILGFLGAAPLWLVAGTWEASVMAVALADRFFRERQAKMAAQEAIIDTLKRSETELEHKVAQRTQELQLEQARTQELLHNMLPQAIAEELAATGTTQSVRHESATVLFTDFVGFTQAAASMPPQRMVAELNEIFAAFDHITDACGVEKIKTIGDAYMAAAGVPNPCPDHAQRCVRAGLAMVRYLQERNANAAFKWQLRVGIHTGPVVAGVVGTKKFAFDIWGDTVNIASRMESSGEAERVNVSAYTYDLIRNDFICEYRGKVAAKGKGEVDMYFVRQDSH